MSRPPGLLRPLVHGWLRLAYPPVCAVCAVALSDNESAFCAVCRGRIVATSPACRRCAGPLGPHVDPNAGCSLCLRESFAFDAAYRLGSYDGLLRELILRAKFHGPALAEYLADLWCDVAAEPLRNAGCDVVVPVPLHWRRRLWRGYNGAEAVAQVLAERLGLPCHAAALKRIRSTPVQPGHSWTQRRVNVRGAFRASRWADLRGRRVLLVDDVMTSGSTASASSVALKQAGAVHLVVAVLARAGLSS